MLSPTPTWQFIAIEKPTIPHVRMTVYGFWRISGTSCEIYLQPRPVYCDRGNWVAHVEARPGSALARDLDGADGFPRYYFDLDHAKAEIEAWLEKRKQKL